MNANRTNVWTTANHCPRHGWALPTLIKNDNSGKACKAGGTQRRRGGERGGGEEERRRGERGEGNAITRGTVGACHSGLTGFRNCRFLRREERGQRRRGELYILFFIIICFCWASWINVMRSAQLFMMSNRFMMPIRSWRPTTTSWRQKVSMSWRQQFCHDAAKTKHGIKTSFHDKIFWWPQQYFSWHRNRVSDHRWRLGHPCEAPLCR